MTLECTAMVLGHPGVSSFVIDHLGGAGLRWVSACAEGEGPIACASLPRLDWAAASSCLVSQPPRLLTIPKPPPRHWWEGDICGLAFVRF